MASLVLLLGSNMGNRRLYLEKTLEYIEKHIGKIIQASSTYETEAWGQEGQLAYLNQAVSINTEITPRKLINTVLNIEKKMGRVRKKKWEDRIIDIDILLYGDSIIQLPTLEIPHPLFTERRFALTAVAEILPNRIHPVYGITITKLLEKCTDQLSVTVIPRKT